MLEKQGYLSREPHTSRSIRLTRAPGMTIPGMTIPGVPIRGLIAAGEPLDLFDDESPADRLDLGVHLRSSDLTREDAADAQEQEFALQVRGDSMIEDRIFDGDYVLVRPGKEAHQGEIVVAVHITANGQRGAATIKRLYVERSRRRVRLQPANAAHPPIYVKADTWAREWEIQGIVTAVYRPFPSTPQPTARPPYRP
jgi:repressor LexA